MKIIYKKKKNEMKSVYEKLKAVWGEGRLANSHNVAIAMYEDGM